jgi:CRISPR-associated RAMP protein (TIGR02581 family)
MTTTSERSDRFILRNRYQFTGRLKMKTALHIGGGRTSLSPSDSPVVLTVEGIPFIPGSSFKGAMRSTVEKLAPNLSNAFTSCGLVELSDKEIEEKLQAGEFVCSTQRQKYFAEQRRSHPENSQAILEEALDGLCSTCRLFGSPFAAAPINVNDLYMPDAEKSDIIQIRDGVAIDRDSEKAKDRLKYDFEVVPSTTVFELTITLENASEQDVQLACVGLSEFVHGYGAIGGLRSRGLGACTLENLEASALELTGVNENERNRRLRTFLLNGEFPDKVPGEQFLKEHIEKII